MAIDDVFKLELVMTFTGVDDIINTFHYSEQGGLIFTSPAEDLANAWLNDAWPTYRLFLSSRITLQTIRVRPVDPLDSFFDLTVEENGTHGAGDICPLIDAPIVTWLTAFIGRSNRGRVYLPPPQESVNDAGSLTSPYLELIEDWAVENIILDGGILTGLWQQVIHSEVTGLNPDVTAFVTRDIMGHQERRKQGVGS